MLKRYSKLVLTAGAASLVRSWSVSLLDMSSYNSRTYQTGFGFLKGVFPKFRLADQPGTTAFLVPTPKRVYGANPEVLLLGCKPNAYNPKQCVVMARATFRQRSPTRGIQRRGPPAQHRCSPCSEDENSSETTSKRRWSQAQRARLTDKEGFRRHDTNARTKLGVQEPSWPVVPIPKSSQPVEARMQQKFRARS